MSEDRTEKPALRLSLFGGPLLSVADRGEIDLSPLQAALLAVVGAAGPEGVSRTRLIHLLWDADPDARTRHRLSQLLYSLAEKIGDVDLLDATPERVRLDLGAVRSDLGRMREGRRTSGRSLRQELDAIARVAETEPLSRLRRPPTRSFEEWLHRTRARMRSELRELVAAVWSNCSDEARWQEAARAAALLLDLDPFSEEALRRLLRAMAMAGRIDEATATFVGFRERWEAHPDREAWEPEPETRTLLTRLETLERAPEPPPEIQSSPRSADPPFCGRHRERARLGRIIAARDVDRLTTICVSGEGGIGKTRLIAEAARDAGLRGYLTLKGGTSRFEQDIPLNLLLDALDREEVGDVLNGLEDPWRSVLLSLLPEFHREDGPLPEVPTIKPGNIPRRMYEAVHRLVEAVAEEAPLFLFLDDFQWADETSVAALEFFRRRWSGGRLILVLGMRRERLGPRSPGLELAEELLGEEETVGISLEQLEMEAAQRLVDVTASRPVPAEIRDRICRLGRMNPFFLVELTHEHLEGRLTSETSGGAGELPVPISIRQVLERRFVDLTERDAHVLDVLTVHDRPVPWSALPDVTEREPEACVASVERLETLRLVGWEDEGLTIRHELIRHAVYGRLTKARRAYLHERVARSLLRSHEAQHPDELALHFDRAGLRDEALEYSMEAADRAEASGGVPEALHFLAMARRNTDDPEKAATIVGRLGHLNYLHRNLQDAAPLLEVAANRFREQDRLSEALAVEVERIDALSRMQSLPLPDFLEELSRIKEEARAREEWETLAQALDVEVHTLDRRGEVEGVRRVLSEVEEIADKGSVLARCAARTVLAIDVYYRSPGKALRNAEQAVSLARKTGDKDRLLTAINRLLVVQIAQGRFAIDGGERLVEEARVSSKTSSDLFQRFVLRSNVGLWLTEIGEYDRAQNLFAEAGKIIQDTNAHFARFALELNLGELKLLQKRFDEALNHYKQAESVPPVGLPTYAIDSIAAGKGLCELAVGQLAAAQKRLKDLKKYDGEWVFDPFIIVLFEARIKERLENANSAAVYLREQTDAIAERFVPTWIKLKLEEARLLRKVDKIEMRNVAQKGAEVAKRLQMPKRVIEFERRYGA